MDWYKIKRVKIVNPAHPLFGESGTVKRPRIKDNTAKVDKTPGFFVSRVDALVNMIGPSRVQETKQRRTRSTGR